MWQQLVDCAGTLGRQALENVFQVGIGVMAIELCGLDQARDRGGALASGKRSGVQPVLASCRPGPDLSLVVVVVCALSRHV